MWELIMKLWKVSGNIGMKMKVAKTKSAYILIIEQLFAKF